MSIPIIFSILILHWIADFVLQSDWMAKNKSKDNGALFAHVIVYSTVFSTTSTLYSLYRPEIELINVFYFSIITFALHFITDYFTSRLNSKLWVNGNVHYFFVSVGFDQIIHYVSLILTFNYFLA